MLMPLVLLMPLVDNEFSQSIGDTYFQDLEDVYHASAIVVPLTYNDPNQGSNFINGTVSLLIINHGF